MTAPPPKKQKFTTKEVDAIVSEFDKETPGETTTDLFKVEKISDRMKEKFNVRLQTFSLSVSRKSSVNFISFITSLRLVFTYLIKLTRDSVSSDEDYVRFIFSKAPKSYFSTAVLKVKDISADYFLNVFEKHMQSNREMIAHGWETNVIIQTFPTNSKITPKQNKAMRKSKIYTMLGRVNEDKGGGKKTCTYPVKYGRQFRTGVFYIICDKLSLVISQCCFVVALLVGLSYLRKDWKYDRMAKNPSHSVDDLYSEHELRDVYQKCGIPEGAVRSRDFCMVYKNFLAVQGVDLVVFSDKYDDMIIYDSRTNENGELIKLTNDVVCLWLNNEHYDVVLNLCEFSKVNKSEFCIKCMSYYTHYEFKDSHICKINLTCKKCYTLTPCTKQDNVKVECPLCHVLFYNMECYLKHITHKIFKAKQITSPHRLSPCQYMFFCKTCYKITPRFFFITATKSVQHNCNKTFCVHCNNYLNKSHYCFMKPITRVRTKSLEKKIFFFDFETKVVQDNIFQPFYCVVQKICSLCQHVDFKAIENNLSDEQYNDSSVEVVSCCGARQFIFEGDTVTEDLCQFILEQENSVWIAHNGGRFDTIFILKHLLERETLIPDTILNGTKIMSMIIKNKNIRFLDSYMFLGMSLKKVPEAMGIDNLCKGFHPYLFYDLEYQGDLVAKSYFNIEDMDEKTKTIFDAWYVKKQDTIYIFRHEIKYYCTTDVDILRKGCVKFSSLIKNSTGIIPFFDSNYITISSLAMGIYRTLFLKKNTIGILPAGGYRRKICQSLEALIWLDAWNQTLNQGLEYMLSRYGERKILGRYVDGFHGNTVYQFHGCFYHGCPTCYDSREFNSVLKESYYVLYNRTQRFTQALRDAGYTVVEQWECDFKSTYSVKEKQIKKEEFFPYLPLNSRDALFGGRTSPVCLYKCVEDDEKIRYVDFTSLYPYVQKYRPFPIGHPTVLLEADCKDLNLDHVFGLIKCKILPPTQLYFPVLPVRVDHLLLFPLCYQCALLKNEWCDHTDSERCLLGTWTSVEIIKAIEKGYKLITVYEIYDFKQQGFLFQEYVNTFLKIKQEASGYPPSCYDTGMNLNMNAVEEYCKNYSDREGVTLDPSTIEKNPGLRTIAKMLLNSLWGKFAQNENNTQVAYLNDYTELMELVNNRSVDVTTMDFISDSILRCTYNKIDDVVIPLKTGNVIIACFVTAYARLMLYDLIDSLGERCLYFDTDSVIFLCNEENYDDIPTGNFLGELTNEIKKPSDWITQFCSTGPKCYSYITNVNEECVHVKGFALKSEVKKIINMESLTRCVKDNRQIINITYKHKISRNKLNHLFIQDEQKQFTFTFNKRIVRADFTTVPYGFLG